MRTRGNERNAGVFIFLTNAAKMLSRLLWGTLGVLPELFPAALGFGRNPFGQVGEIARLQFLLPVFELTALIRNTYNTI